MTKAELERAYNSLKNNYDDITSDLIYIRLFLDNNLEFFRNGLADEEDEYTAAVKDVLVSLGKLWNSKFKGLKVDLPHEFGGKIIQFPRKREEE